MCTFDLKSVYLAVWRCKDPVTRIKFVFHKAVRDIGSSAVYMYCRLQRKVGICSLRDTEQIYTTQNFAHHTSEITAFFCVKFFCRVRWKI